MQSMSAMHLDDESILHQPEIEILYSESTIFDLYLSIMIRHSRFVVFHFCRLINLPRSQPRQYQLIHVIEPQKDETNRNDSIFPPIHFGSFLFTPEHWNIDCALRFDSQRRSNLISSSRRSSTRRIRGVTDEIKILDRGENGRIDRGRSMM